MTINKAMNIALTGLNAHQAALNVVSHNIANINTEGYRRQQVHFAEMRTPLYDNSVSGQIASLAGVKIDGIKTASNDYLNDYFRKQNALYEGLQTGADIAAGVAGLLDELQDSALGDSLNAFYEAANSLYQNPTDYSMRVNFVAKAKAVANKFNALDTSLKNYATSVIGDGSDGSAQASQVGTDVSKLNSQLEKLANINLQLSRTPDDTNLQSQRDQVLSKISSLADVDVKITETGTANVSIGNAELVSGVKVVGKLEYSTVTDANGSINPRIQAIDVETKRVKDVTKDFTGGSIGGVISGLETLTTAQSDLNRLAKAFADQMNGIQQYVNGNEQACYYDRQNDVLVKNPPALFEGTTAGDIKINNDVYNNPDLVAAARLDTSAVNWEKAVGNGDNALFFFNAKSAKLTDLDGLSMQDFLIAMGTKAALSADDLQKQADAQGSIVDSINNQILSETGVNLDEELSNMIIYQQGYNASARMFSTCVEVFDTLVNLGK